MARSDITGKRKLKAQNVSHSNIKTKRWQHVNIQTRRIWVPELGRFVTLNVTHARHPHDRQDRRDGVREASRREAVRRVSRRARSRARRPTGTSALQRGFEGRSFGDSPRASSRACFVRVVAREAGGHVEAVVAGRVDEEHARGARERRAGVDAADAAHDGLRAEGREDAERVDREARRRAIS